MINHTVLVTGDFDIPNEFGPEKIIHLRFPKNNSEIIAKLKDATHYIVGGPEYVDKDILCHAPNLKQVIVMGTGTNSFIDIVAAQAQGIIVDNTPSINANAVAEFALGAIISNLSNVFFSHDNLLEGGWYQKPHKTLSEAKIGIIGMGNIGKNLLQKLRSISSADISYFSRTRHAEIEEKLGCKFGELPSLVSECDVVVLCVSYSPETHHMINRSILEKANESLILLNFSNPLVVDPFALRENLEAGGMQFAYFDGYYNEWVKNSGQKSDEYGLLSLGSDKFVATSHIAAQSQAIIKSLLKEAFAKISIIKIKEQTVQPTVLVVEPLF